MPGGERTTASEKLIKEGGKQANKRERPFPRKDEALKKNMALERRLLSSWGFRFLRKEAAFQNSKRLKILFIRDFMSASYNKERWSEFDWAQALRKDDERVAAYLR